MILTMLFIALTFCKPITDPGTIESISKMSPESIMNAFYLPCLAGLPDGYQHYGQLQIVADPESDNPQIVVELLHNLHQPMRNIPMGISSKPEDNSYPEQGSLVSRLQYRTSALRSRFTVLAEECTNTVVAHECVKSLELQLAGLDALRADISEIPHPAVLRELLSTLAACELEYGAQVNDLMTLGNRVTRLVELVKAKAEDLPGLETAQGLDDQPRNTTENYLRQADAAAKDAPAAFMGNIEALRAQYPGADITISSHGDEVLIDLEGVASKNLGFDVKRDKKAEFAAAYKQSPGTGRYQSRVPNGVVLTQAQLFDCLLHLKVDRRIVLGTVTITRRKGEKWQIGDDSASAVHDLAGAADWLTKAGIASPSSNPTLELSKDDIPVSVVRNLLLMVDIEVPDIHIAAWTPEQRKQATTWAGDVSLAASDNDDVKPGPQPEFLKRYPPADFSLMGEDGKKVTYYTQEEIDTCDHKEFCGLTTAGWYFWDETEAGAHGPYADHHDGYSARCEYAKHLNEEKPNGNSEIKAPAPGDAGV